MILYTKKLIKSEDLDNKILNTIVNYDSIIFNHVIEPYNILLEDLKKFYASKSIVVYTQKEGEHTIEYHLEFNKLVYEKPILTYSNGECINLTPELAILKQVNYVSNMYADLKLIEVVDGISKIKYAAKNKKIGAIPVMRGSTLDLVEPETYCSRGYFILKGVEKIVLAVEEINDNIPIANITEDAHELYLYSSINGYRYINRLIKHNKRKLEYKFQPLNATICPILLLKVLGYTDRQIIERVVDPSDSEANILFLSWLQSSGKNRSIEYAQETLAKMLLFTELVNIQEKIEYIVQNYMLMHLGTTEQSIPVKAEYIIGLIKSMLSLKLGRETPLNIDDLEHKKIKTPGVLFAELFYYCFNKQIETFKSALIKNASNKSLNLLNLFKPEVLTNGLISPIISGVWVGNRQDVSTTIEKTNPYTYFSIIRKIISPLLKTQLHASARSISSNFRGRICPVDSGHGTIVGLVKSLAMGALVTTGNTAEIPIRKFKVGETPMYIDEVFIKNVDKELFIKDFIELRYKKIIDKFVNFNITKQGIHIRTSSGRITRVLYTKKAKITDKSVYANLSLHELETEGYISWLDSLEEMMYSVSPSLEEMSKEDTYAEINPILLFNITSASIPFINNSGPARISYGQKLFKQAVVSAPKKPTNHTDKKKIVMNYGEKPLVHTGIQDFMNHALEGKHTGVNVTIAVMPYSGYNIEDAAIMSKAAIQRGLFKAYAYEQVVAESHETNMTNILEGFAHKEYVVKSKPELNYNTVDVDGLAEPNTVINPGQAIITNYSLPRYSESIELADMKPSYVDNTVFNSKLTPVTVSDVVITKSPHLSNIVYSTQIIDEPTTTGDKFSSRFAQKGVLGAVLDPWNLIYEKESGIIPDIVIAGSAYPTRYLIGHLLEILTARACATSGTMAETFFSTGIKDYDSLFQILESAGVGKYSCVEYVDPQTGLITKSKVFSGVSYYLKLHHLAKEKLHMRSTGPVQLLTRQATEGRSQVGGLRLGEMERDCIIAYGASDLILERLAVDLSEFLVCAQCGEFVDLIYKQRAICEICHSSLNLQRIKIPYAFKLLIDELNTLHIKVKIIVEKYSNE